MKTDSFHVFQKLVEQLASLHQKAVTELTPQVQEIIASKSQDVTRIERTLDLLLDSACINEGLELLRDLCRYYWEIDAASTAIYINGYREMWDDDSLS